MIRARAVTFSPWLVNRASGCPINFNFLIGDELVTLATGHEASLTAEAIAAFYGTANSPCPAAISIRPRLELILTEAVLYE